MAREPIHPGEHLADELKEIGLSARELARELNVPATRITEILRGRRGITGDTALRLGRYFQVSPDFWMNLQKLYELDVARQQIDGDLASITPRRRNGGSGVDDPVQPPAE
jgi:addiction module HigA family antidote